MRRVAYKLLARPGSGFHLGREGLEQETSADSFPSDSLLSAMIAATAEIEGGEAIQELVNTAERGVFALSSAFPMIGDLPLFPLPRVRVNLIDEAQPKDKRLRNPAKKLKKIHYVSPQILARLLQNEPMDDWLPQESDAINQGMLLNGGAAWIAAQERDQLPVENTLTDYALLEAKFWGAEPVPRVAIDRVTNASAVYQVGRTVFAADCGLWFMADVADDLTDWLDTLVHYLGDSGIGGERSAGYGAFTPNEFTAPNLPNPTRTPRAMALSRYHPTESELVAGVLGAGAAYDLVDVGGWMGAPGHLAQRRQRVRMIEAGSVLNVAGGVPVGQIRDVRPTYGGLEFPHPIYRSGIGLFIGVSAGGDA